jgi:O-antigen ligase
VSGPAAGAPIDASRLPALPGRAVRPGRVVLWSAAGRMLADHPILGVGPDNFRLRYERYVGLSGADRRVHSNNMYLEVLTGGGGVAGLAFLWLFWSAAARSLALARRSSDQHAAALGTGLVAAAAAIALHGLVDSFLSFTGTYILMAITLGLVVAGDRVLSQSEAPGRADL